MIVLTTALFYDVEHVRAFFHSLKDSGYQGRIAAVTNQCGASRWMKARGVEIIPDPGGGYPINSRRFLAWKEFLRGVSEPTIITDVRDVIFQKNPEEFMPQEGVHVYQEYEGMTIGECPYNSKWMRHIFSEVPWSDRNIICAGVTSGFLTEYAIAVWECLKNLPPTVGLDQAVHNHLAYSGRISATIHANEESEVYTVGYLPKGTVRIERGVIYNKEGKVPCMVHQYDRHPNLKKGIPWR